jgi:hypothetical protein
MASFMNTSLRTFWKTGIIVASTLALATAAGCGDDDDDDGAAASAGRGGSAAGEAGDSSGGKSPGKGGTAAGGTNTGKAGSASAGSGGSDSGYAGDVSAAGGANEAGSTGVGDRGGAGGAGDEPGQAGAGGGANATCQEYCDWVQTGCAAAADTQYPSENQCLQSCAAFPQGAGNNSFSCRAEQAALIATDVNHCDAAGPAGVGVCGSPCQAYCSLMTTYCPNEADGASLVACLAECATVPGNDLTTFVYPGAAGDTLACRIAHVTNAAADPDPNGVARLLHCNHAAGDAGPCLDATP